MRNEGLGEGTQMKGRDCKVRDEEYESTFKTQDKIKLYHGQRGKIIIGE